MEGDVNAGQRFAGQQVLGGRGKSLSEEDLAKVPDGPKKERYKCLDAEYEKITAEHRSGTIDTKVTKSSNNI